MDWAICLRIVVLPAFGGETMRPRWPLPIGVMRSMTRGAMSLGFHSRRRRSCGKSGVRSSKFWRRRPFWGSSPLTVSMRTIAGYFSPSRAGRIWPTTWSPRLRLKRLIWLVETYTSPRLWLYPPVLRKPNPSGNTSRMPLCTVSSPPRLSCCPPRSCCLPSCFLRSSRRSSRLPSWRGGRGRPGLGSRGLCRAVGLLGRDGRHLGRRLGLRQGRGGGPVAGRGLGGAVGRLGGRLARLLGGDLVDHLRELRLSVLAVLLDAELRGDLVQVAQALAFEGCFFGHADAPPFLFCDRGTASLMSVVGFLKAESPCARLRAPGRGWYP